MIELRSEDLPTAERFPWWCELTSRQMYPTLLSSDHADDYRAAVKVLELGRVTVAVPEFDCMRAVRTQRLIRRSDPEVWTLTLICGGSLWIEQDRERHELRIGDLVLQDPSRPFRSEALEAGGVARTVQLDLPRRSLPVPEQASARGTLCWQKLPGEIRFTVDGSLKDSAGDGRYAVFRIHYRSRTAVGWSTHTKDIRTTKGHNAPVSLYVDWRGSASRGLKDFWMQVCKQGGGKRTCDGHWH
ncbi:hypothetical protein AB0O28_24745 [Microbispora sp. NPDC088329]|uniref:AraC-like ligand-binding domain-containing protein n=1 Tax=Microbispora sp. NPDC088329 TaxID=3154869 RepID=UPI003434B56C